MAWGAGNTIVADIHRRRIQEEAAKRAAQARQAARKASFEKDGMTEALKDTYRNMALNMFEKCIASYRGSLGKHTGCIMFYNHDGLLKHKIDMSGPVAAGNQSKLDALRTSAGVRTGKRSNCAEERVLIRNPGYKFLFSIAFETEGTKSACGGCALILADERNNIEDLV